MDPSSFMEAIAGLKIVLAHPRLDASSIPCAVMTLMIDTKFYSEYSLTIYVKEKPKDVLGWDYDVALKIWIKSLFIRT